MRLAWLTDIHLECVPKEGLAKLADQLTGHSPDAILIGGDIGYAYTIGDYLTSLVELVGSPVYFVLGNHDYWGGWIAETRASVQKLCAGTPNLNWLPDAGVARLTDAVGLIGHGAWADGRLGDFEGSSMMMSDFAAIHDFAEPPDDYRRRAEARGVKKIKAEWLFSDEGMQHRKHLVASLGDEAARHFRTVLPQALDVFDRVILLTHVPPFPEAARCASPEVTETGLPHFVCKAAGDALHQVMSRYPQRHLTVLCGHTHSEGYVKPLRNLEVFTGGAEYTKPKIQKVLSLD